MGLANDAAQSLKPVREMPQFPAAIGVKNDHAYLERCRGMGPFLRDRFNTITSFSMAHLNHFFFFCSVLLWHLTKEIFFSWYLI